MKLLQGTEIVKSMPLLDYESEWRKTHHKNNWMTGYHALVRGWRLSVFAVHDGTFTCRVEEQDLDYYNFGFARRHDAERLLRYVMEYRESDADEITEKALGVVRSNKNSFWKHMSLTKLAYELVKGTATSRKKNTLKIVLASAERMDYEVGAGENLFDLIGYSDCVDFILGE